MMLPNARLMPLFGRPMLSRISSTRSAGITCANLLLDRREVLLRVFEAHALPAGSHAASSARSPHTGRSRGR